MKKILFYSPFTFWEVIWGLELEIISKHIQQGDNIVILGCRRDLKTCEPNRDHTLKNCRRCMIKRENGLELLGIKDKVITKSFKLLTIQDRLTVIEYIRKAQFLDSLEELKSLKLEECDIGMAVASSLISYLREPKPDINKYKEYIIKSVESAVMVYLSIKNHLNTDDYDLLYMFNGRYSVIRPALRAAQKVGVPVKVSEVSYNDFKKYILVDNNYVHDLEMTKINIINNWNNNDYSDEFKIERGSNWFEKRIDKKDNTMFSFVKYQSDEKPKNLDKNKINIAIFNSSQDEFEAIDGWENNIYKDSNEALEKIGKDLENYSNINIYLRVHPHLKGVHNSQTTFLKTLEGKFKNFHVIRAESTVNSYKLMDVCDVVITFGSTMGVEAVYFQKPSLLLAPAYYEDLNVCSIINSHEELIDILINEKFKLTEDILLPRKNNAIKYGYYMSIEGEKYEVFDKQGLINTTYQGKNIDGEFPTFLERLFWKFQYLIMKKLNLWQN